MTHLSAALKVAAGHSRRAATAVANGEHAYSSKVLLESQAAVSCALQLNVGTLDMAVAALTAVTSGDLARAYKLQRRLALTYKRAA
jgi:hypothetical protein